MIEEEQEGDAEQLTKSFSNNSPWPAGVPQFYLSCAHISVTGGGSASPATVSIPGAFKETDPGYTVNVSSFSPIFSPSDHQVAPAYLILLVGFLPKKNLLKSIHCPATMIRFNPSPSSPISCTSPTSKYLY